MIHKLTDRIFHGFSGSVILLLDAAWNSRNRARLIGSCFSRPAVPLLDKAEIQGLRHDDGGFLLIDDLTKRWERAEARRQGVNPGDQKLTLQAVGLDDAVELGCRLM